MSLPWIIERQERLRVARETVAHEVSLSGEHPSDVLAAATTLLTEVDQLLEQRDVLIELLVTKVADKDSKDFFRQCVLDGMVPMRAKLPSALDEEEVRELVHLRNEHIRLSWHLPITPHSSGREDLSVKAKLALEEARADGWREASEVSDVPKPVATVLRAKAESIVRLARKDYDGKIDLPRKKRR